MALYRVTFIDDTISYPDREVLVAFINFPSRNDAEERVAEALDKYNEEQPAKLSAEIYPVVVQSLEDTIESLKGC